MELKELVGKTIKIKNVEIQKEEYDIRYAFPTDIEEEKAVAKISITFTEAGKDYLLELKPEWLFDGGETHLYNKIKEVDYNVRL